MRRHRLVGGWLLVVSAPLSAERLDGPPPGLVGLASPGLAAEGPPGCERPDTSREYSLRAGPGDAHPRVGSLRFRPWAEDDGHCNEALPRFAAEGEDTDRPVPMLERGYGEPALPLLGKQQDWLHVGLGEGSAWLKWPAGFVVEDYPQLLAEKLAYPTEAWSGELCDSAGARCRPFKPAGEPTVRVLSIQRMGGADWIEIELSVNVCRSGETVRLDQGWIRSHDAEGRPTVWFHSRGC